MDLTEYFGNVRRVEKELAEKYPDRIVHVTSLKNSMRNSTAGTTLGATPYNAARCIVDETHREATEDEIRGFFEHQERNRLEATRSENRKKKEIVVVMDRGQAAEEFPEQSRELVESAMASRKQKRGASVQEAQEN